MIYKWLTIAISNSLLIHPRLFIENALLFLELKLEEYDMRGFYKMEFTGQAGQGAGAIAFVDGKVAGADIGGGFYKGEFQVTPGGMVTGYADLSFPDGGVLATSGQTVPAGGPSMRIPFSIEEAQVGSAILRVETPSGPANLRLTLVSEL